MRYMYSLVQTLFPYGAASKPGLAFLGDNNTGLFRNAADQLSIATGGIEVVRATTTGTGLYTGTASTTDALSIVESTHATSRRAAITLGLQWRFGQDNAANGTKDNFLYNIGTAQLIWVINPTTSVLDFKVAPTINGVSIGTGTGSVSSITFSSPLTGGTISTSGTVGLSANGITNTYLATMVTGTLKGNFSGSTATPSDYTVTSVLDNIGSVRGSILYRGVSAWTPLTPGTSGRFLQSSGAGADPVWSSFTPADNSITVTGTGFLTGGGALTANRTISIANFSGASRLLGAGSASSAPAEISLGTFLTMSSSTLKVSDLSSTSQLIGSSSVSAVATNITLGNRLTMSSSALQVSAMSAVSKLMGSNDASTAVTDITLGAGLAMSGSTMSAKWAQIANSSSSALATGTTTIPADDTIPQNTEGDQYLSVTITPTSSTSTLIIEVNLVLSNTATTTMIVALFQDSTASAIAAVMSKLVSANDVITIPLRWTMTSGTVSATTFKVRAGGALAGTTTLNGSASARLLGGVMASTIVIYESR